MNLLHAFNNKNRLIMAVFIPYTPIYFFFSGFSTTLT